MFIISRHISVITNSAVALLQRGRTMLRAIEYVAKSLKVIQGHSNDTLE